MQAKQTALTNYLYITTTAVSSFCRRRRKKRTKPSCLKTVDVFVLFFLVVRVSSFPLLFCVHHSEIKKERDTEMGYVLGKRVSCVEAGYMYRLGTV